MLYLRRPHASHIMPLIVALSIASFGVKGVIVGESVVYRIRLNCFEGYSGAGYVLAQPDIHARKFFSQLIQPF
jgi:hypothetical protein